MSVRSQHSQPVILASTGEALSNVQVTVNNTETQVAATIYTSKTGGVTKPNPFTTDATGLMEFWAEPGSYDIELHDLESTPRFSDREYTWEAISGAIVGGVDGPQLEDAAVTTTKIADGAVITGKISDSSITSAKIATDSITTAKILNNNVTGPKIPSGTIGTSHIIDNAVTTPKISDTSITTAKIVDTNVTTNKIADFNITSSKLANDSVTGQKLASATVTETKIVDGSITKAKIAASAQALLVPTGVILPFAGSSAPTGYLICDGSAVSRTTYSDLFAIIGTVYGTGDGSTTFNLPDGRARAMYGKGTNADFDDLGGNDGIAEVSRSGSGSLTFSSHTHSPGSFESDGSHVHGPGTLRTESHNHGGFTGVNNNQADTDFASGWTAASDGHTHTISSTQPFVTEGQTATASSNDAIIGTSGATGGFVDGNVPYLTINHIIKT